jgi:hypothetical protein
MWSYVQRTSRDVLPARYRNGLIHLRRAPRVPARLLKATHYRLLQELSAAPCSFDALVQRTGLDSALLSRDLASLYFAGSITSAGSQAAEGLGSREDTARARAAEAGSASAQSPLGPDSQFNA